MQIPWVKGLGKNTKFTQDFTDAEERKILKVLLYFWFWVHEDVLRQLVFLMSLLHVILGTVCKQSRFLVE